MNHCIYCEHSGVDLDTPPCKDCFHSEERVDFVQSSTYSPNRASQIKELIAVQKNLINGQKEMIDSLKDKISDLKYQKKIKITIIIIAIILIIRDIILIIN